MFNESNTVGLMPTDLRRFTEFGLKWSNLVVTAKF